MKSTESALLFWELLIAALVAGLVAATFVALGIRAFRLTYKVLCNEKDAVFQSGYVQLRRRTHWLDFYASRDPVPQGRLFEKRVEQDYLRTSDSTRVYNRSSFISDHTSYWQNMDDFVSRIVTVLDRFSQLDSIKISDKEKKQFAKVRHKRTEWLWRYKYGLVALTGSLIVAGHSQPAILRSAGDVLRGMVHHVEALLRASMLERAIDSVSDRTLGCISIVLIAIGIYLTIRVIWRYWDGRYLEYFFSGKEADVLNRQWDKGLSVLFLTISAIIIFIIFLPSLLAFTTCLFHHYPSLIICLSQDA